MPQVWKLSTAENDIDGIVAYLAERNVEAAIALIDAIEETLRLVSRSPTIGTPVDAKPGGFRVVATRRFKNYLIYFRLTDDRIEVARVVHGARDQTNILTN